MSNLIIHHYDSKEVKVFRLSCGEIDVRIDYETAILFLTIDDARDFSESILRDLDAMEVRERKEKEMEGAELLMEDR